MGREAVPEGTPLNADIMESLARIIRFQQSYETAPCDGRCGHAAEDRSYWPADVAKVPLLDIPFRPDWKDRP